MNFEQLLIIAGAGWVIAIGFLVYAIALRTKLKGSDEMLNQFKVLSAEALHTTNESFMAVAQERFKAWEQASQANMTQKQNAVADIVKPVRDHLEKLGGAVNELKGTSALVREDLQTLSQSTLKLAGAMNNPAMRGRWGEMLLDRLLEKAGMVRGVHYDTQATVTDEGGSRLRPDIVITLQDGFKIAIDAKAPIQDVLEDLDKPEAQDTIRARLAQQVRAHIKALGAKSYQEALGSPVDFTVLFLPGEHLFSLAIAGDPDLIDYAADNNIIVTSPSLMLSLLRVVHLSWRQGELAENAQKIADTGRDLYKSLSSFGTHLDKIGTNLDRSVGAYNDAMGSLERNVLIKARKFEELQAVHQTDSLPDIKVIEKQVRSS